ncbi:MAG: GTP-binding protein, partial [Candidatus Omnitrophica bacterium]|nr:GTP-binding protein [Candidatus Omnitrophota bacterium]
MAVETENIRNVILLGHSGSGKTSIVESLLFNGSAIPKPGSVTEGNTVSDYNEDEIERKISINSSLSYLTHNNIKVTLIDTPGYSDFIGGVIGGLIAADAGILVLNAVNGMEMGTEKFYKMIKQKGIPFAIFINRVDKENADFDKCIQQINKKIGKNCACVTYPIGSASQFKGIANLLTNEGLQNIEGDKADKAKKLSEALVESIAESDDALLEKYLDKGELSEEEIKVAFRKAV